ncbi:hypothetical protein H310_11722 [Aphanomyces invadans]|uniref:Zinc finger PHD-type domain-containing protein n=1 Tax=Aphanomyces invadans TaxID=157072 RepID=A0A024TMB6_9STRA|nr:hypothetical protein H310_11722 [Aphanomyces invadans]ETV94766.1 hypothetical protein H310_11722 [Aphanomyces invadans]|eukprot:XP_008876711.1 hypothetical protein H310_11722 [Aphanomyces invadans]
MDGPKYPPLTDDMTVFIPKSELRHRTLLPSVFDAQLIMEGPMIPFIYERNFLVMTNDGLRHKRLEGMCKEPRVTTRPKDKHPMLKIVDMISCTSIHDRNETCTLVRVRWQNLDWTNDTWVLTNQVENTALLQQFYVGASSSWQTSQFISKMARYRYPSEEQLWDDEPGIADWKREHRITGLTKPSENSASFSSATHPHLRALPPSSGSSRPVDHHPLNDSHPSSRRPNAPSEQYSFHYARFGTSKKHSPTATEIATDAAKLSSAAAQAAKQAFAQDSLATSQPARRISTPRTPQPTQPPSLMPRRHSDTASTPPSSAQSSNHQSQSTHHRRVVSHSSPRRSPDRQLPLDQPRVVDDDVRKKSTAWVPSRPSNNELQRSSARAVVEVSEARHQNGDGRRGNDSTNLRDDAPWEVKEPRSKRIRAASPLSSEAASTEKAEAAHAPPRHFVHDRLAVLADRRLKRQKASQPTATTTNSSNAPESPWQIPKRQPPTSTAAALPSKYCPSKLSLPGSPTTSDNASGQDHGMSPPRKSSPARQTSLAKSHAAPAKDGLSPVSKQGASDQAPTAPTAATTLASRSDNQTNATASVESSKPNGDGQGSSSVSNGGWGMETSVPLKKGTGWGDLPPTRPSRGWGDLPSTKPSGSWGSPRHASSPLRAITTSARGGDRPRPRSPSKDAGVRSTPNPETGTSDQSPRGSSSGWGHLLRPVDSLIDVTPDAALERRRADKSSSPPFASNQLFATESSENTTRKDDLSDELSNHDNDGSPKVTAQATQNADPVHPRARHDVVTVPGNAEGTAAAQEPPRRDATLATSATSTADDGPTTEPSPSNASPCPAPVVMAANAAIPLEEPRSDVGQHPVESQPESKHHDSIEPESPNVDAAPRVPGASHTQVEPTPAPAAATPAVKMHAEPMHPLWRPPTLPRSVIRCLCGATSVEDYIGEWVQCWTESCGSWFHVTCVPTPLTTPYRCASCCGVSRPSFPPVPTPHLLYLCCKANSRRAFRAAIDNFPSKPSFLRYKCLADDNSNGVVVAAKVGAKAILEEFVALFTPSQVTSSVNILNQTPLHVAILHGHFHCLPVLTRLQPLWFQVPDAYSSLPIDYVLQVQPAQVIPLLQDQPELVDVVNSATGNSIAHALCASAPPNFASILALLPPSLLASVNHHGQTPAMLLLRAPNVTRSHFQALVQFSTNASTSNSWWTHVDDQGRTVVHFALTYKHAWALELVDLAAFREFKLLHMAAELGLAQAVALLVSAQFSLRTQHGGDTEPSLTSTGWWPILHASTPTCVLELLRTDTIAQLEYLYQHSQTHSSKVYQILNSIASHLPLYDFVQTIALASPDQYLTGRCQFLQRFRKCLRLDVKLLQLQLHVASIPAVQKSAVSVYAPSEDELWTCIQAQCPTTMNWRRPFELTIQTTVWPSRHPHVWDLLASQLRRLGSHLFDAPSSVFGLLGRLLAHMVVVGQKLSSAVLPPPFLSTPAEFKPDLATAFKAGFDSVLPGVVDNWNGYERFILLHKVEFPQTLQQWKNGLVTYDAPFHPRHPSIVSFWNVIESGLVPQEQVVCRLRCGQPLRITPAPTVGIVEKTVFGVPETISFEKLHVDLVLYIRGFRKQVRKR